MSTPRSSRGYENERDAVLAVGIEDRGGPLKWALLLISSFELDSPATRAKIPSASDGFCRFENGRSSVFEESDRVA